MRKWQYGKAYVASVETKQTVIKAALSDLKATFEGDDGGKKVNIKFIVS